MRRATNLIQILKSHYQCNENDSLIRDVLIATQIARMDADSEECNLFMTLAIGLENFSHQQTLSRDICSSGLISEAIRFI